MIRLAKTAVIAALAWGALAFGGVYPWAYWPMAALCVLAGVAGLRAAGRSARIRPVVFGMGLVLVAIFVQTIPLSPQHLQQVSPETVSAVSRLDLAYAIGVEPRHALSIDPQRTWIGLVFLAALFVFYLGLVNLLSVTGARWLLGAVTVLGVGLALAGIIQKPLYHGKIYGFWRPIEGGTPFGPFVDHDHFAGWMLMAVPLALGWWAIGLSRGMRGIGGTWRDRLLWFGTEQGSRLVLLGAAAVLMSLALVLTMSRSGIGAFALGVVLTGAFVTRGVVRSGRALARIYLVGLVAVVVGWVGADGLTARFTRTNWTEYNGRAGEWSDARAVAAAFPVAGVGYNAYGKAALLYQRHNLDMFVEEAHNDYLELLADGGALVTVPAAILALLLVFEIWGRFRERHQSVTAWWARAAAVTGIVCIALQETVDFSLQMPGNAALFVALCALAAHRPPAPSQFANRK